MANIRGITPEQARQLGWGVYAKMLFLLERKVVHGDLNEYNVIVQVREDLIASRADNQITEEVSESQEVLDRKDELQAAEEQEEIDEVEESG